MSENTQVMSPEEQVLASRVYMPVFLNKVAQYGIVPKTQEDVAELVKIAQMLDVVESKTPAATGASVIKEASDKLAASLGGSGVGLIEAFQADPEVSKALASMRR